MRKTDYPGRYLADRVAAYLTRHGEGATAEIAAALGSPWLSVYGVLNGKRDRFAKSGSGKDARWTLAKAPKADLPSLTARVCSILAAEADAQAVSHREIGRRTSLRQTAVSMLLGGKRTAAEFETVGKVLTALGKDFSWLQSQILRHTDGRCGK